MLVSVPVNLVTFGIQALTGVLLLIMNSNLVSLMLIALTELMENAVEVYASVKEILYGTKTKHDVFAGQELSKSDSVALSAKMDILAIKEQLAALLVLQDMLPMTIKVLVISVLKILMLQGMQLPLVFPVPLEDTKV